MWEFEHSLEVNASPLAIWQLYSDVSAWPKWDDGIAALELHGPFAVGTTGTITPVGQESLPFRLVEVSPNEGFADETEIPGAGLTIRFSHEILPLAGGSSRITHRVTMSGPAADTLGPQIGSAITAGTPKAMQTLADLAARIGQ